MAIEPRPEGAGYVSSLECLNSYEMWFWPASSGRGSMVERFVVEAIKKEPFHPVEALNGEWRAGTKPLSSRSFGLASLTPGFKPFGDFFVIHRLTRVEFGDRGANFPQWPFLRLDVSRNRLRRQKRL